MFRLAAIIHLFIGSTLAGSGVIAALVSGYDTVYGISIAAALGFLASFPITLLIARKLVAQQ